MDVVLTHCAGLDVHKKSITACRIMPDPTGRDGEGMSELERFGTMTIELLALVVWLTAAGITHVAMESTGEYWKPVLRRDSSQHTPGYQDRIRRTSYRSAA